MKNIQEFIQENKIKSPYLKYAKNTYTQFGDDGIIEQLLSELKLQSGVVVEFGAWDGIYLSNVYNLWKNKKFDAILIESDSIRANEMLSISSSFDNVECMNYPVSPTKGDKYCLDNLLKKSTFNVTNDNLVLVVIDVDSCDYHIFESIENYKPILFIVETAGGWPWDAEYIGTGASLKCLNDLAVLKGYTLVCCNGNAYFVRNDKVSLLKEFNSELTIKDYHMSDHVVVDILGNLDYRGNILDYHHWQHQNYLNFIENEKKELLQL